MLSATTERVKILSFPAPDSPLGSTAAAGQNPAKAALAALYDAHVTPIYKFIYSKVGNREDAEDLTGQVFLKATQHLDLERDAASILAWLYQVARTTITDHWRTYYQAGEVSLEALQDDRGWQWADADPRAEQDDGPAGAQVAAILGALPENYRRVLELRFLRGYSLRETAVALGITESNVKVLQHRALQKASKLSGQVMCAAAA